MHTSATCLDLHVLTAFSYFRSIFFVVPMNRCLISVTKSISCYLCLLYTSKLYVMSPLSWFGWSLWQFLQNGQHSFISSLNSSWGQCFGQCTFRIWQPFRPAPAWNINRLTSQLELQTRPHNEDNWITWVQTSILLLIVEIYFQRKDRAKDLFSQKKASSKYPKIKTFRKFPAIWYVAYYNKYLEEFHIILL